MGGQRLGAADELAVGQAAIPLNEGRSVRRALSPLLDAIDDVHYVFPLDALILDFVAGR
jgi:hypothetical protein